MCIVQSVTGHAGKRGAAALRHSGEGEKGGE